MRSKNDTNNAAARRDATPNGNGFDCGYEIFLIFLIGVLGVCGEVFFYTLVKVGRMIPIANDLFFSFDWRTDASLQLGRMWNAPVESLFGQCSLWMLPVYAGAVLYVVRPLHRLLAEQSFLLRALVYGVAITVFEGSFGSFYEAVLKFSVWTYVDSGAIMNGATSLRILPLWMLVGLLAERTARETNNPIWRAAFHNRASEILEQSHFFLSFVCLLVELADYSSDQWQMFCREFRPAKSLTDTLSSRARNGQISDQTKLAPLYK